MPNSEKMLVLVCCITYKDSIIQLLKHNLNIFICDVTGQNQAYFSQLSFETNPILNNFLGNLTFSCQIILKEAFLK